MKKTICLNMIVKNESRVIRRCLDSVMPFIDFWVIVDTGSTDGTQEIVCEHLKNVPGELHERPWVDFSTNRNQALQLAKGKGDFLLLIDADEQIVCDPDFCLPDLTHDLYAVDVYLANVTAPRDFLINNRLEWVWEGVLHEQLACKEKFTALALKKIKNLSQLDGGRTNNLQEKHYRDIQVLERALNTDPDNSRYVFFLACSYLCTNQYQQAIHYFQRRLTMKGWIYEIYYSLYAIANCQECSNFPLHVIVDSYSKAYELFPWRAEPLYRLGDLYLKQGNPSLAKLFAKEGMSMPVPEPHLRINLEWDIYEYGLKLLYAHCCKFTNQMQEAVKHYHEIINTPRSSEAARQIAKQSIDEVKAASK